MESDVLERNYLIDNTLYTVPFLCYTIQFTKLIIIIGWYDEHLYIVFKI